MNQKLLLFLCLISFLYSCGDSPKRTPKSKKGELATGLVFNEKEYQKIPLKATLMRGLYDNLPSSASLKAYCPTPNSQGQYGTCVGWSSSYAARTILFAQQNNLANQTQIITNNAFSPGFTYRNIKIGDENCERGSQIEDAVKLFKDRGAVKMRDFNDPCPSSVPTSLFSQASNYKIKDYARLWEWFDNLASDSKVKMTKKALSQGKPVIIGMGVTNSFMNLHGQEVWIPRERFQNDLSGHAMCVIGYDDNKFGGAFEIMNSWGTDWGNQGFIWIKYRDYAEFVRQGIELMDFSRAKPAPEPEPKPEPSPKPQPNPTPIPPLPPKTISNDLSGSLVFQLTDGGNMPVSFQNNLYQVTQNYPSKTKFRLLLSNNEPAYVYAFSTDKTDKFVQLFPYKSGSAILDYAKNEVALPDESHSIEMDGVKGTDIFCLLYSKEELDIKKILRDLKREANDFLPSLQNVLGNKLVNPADIQYDRSKMSFKATSRDKSIVPIIVMIPHK